MIIRENTNGTAQQIEAVIQKALNANTRKQVFTAVVECGGSEVIAFPESERDNYPTSFHGYQGIRRAYWNEVPRYAASLCERLARKMTSGKVEY